MIAYGNVRRVLSFIRNYQVLIGPFHMELLNPNQSPKTSQSEQVFLFNKNQVV